MDFEEFLWAYGYELDTIEYLRSFYDKREKIPADINEKFESIFREYMVVGGMPEAVQKFVDTKDYNEVQIIQEKILASYDDDIASHAKGPAKVKIRACYDSLPRQLARENKKFKYSEVEKRENARRFSDSITWLKDSNLVHVCCNVYSCNSEDGFLLSLLLFYRKRRILPLAKNACIHIFVESADGRQKEELPCVTVFAVVRK